MYRHENCKQMKLELPFSVSLNRENRWVILAGMFPWKEIDEAYQVHFSSYDGQVAKPSRLAFGALYIQVSEGYTDEQIRWNIQENLYLQYFGGFDCYNMASPFDACMMTYSRKRITADMIRKINEIVFCHASLDLTDNSEDTEVSSEDFGDESEFGSAAASDVSAENRGTLIIDAAYYSVEFGAKVTVRLVGGYVFRKNTDWNNYSETAILWRAAAKYHDRNGFYPKTILGSRAYPMRENRAWCMGRGIRLSSPRVGRKSAEEKASESRQIYQNECERVEIEGSFGVYKHRYGLDRGMTRLPDT